MSGFVRPPDVGVFEGSDTTYVARLPDGPIVVLNGIAAEIWRCAVRHTDVVDAVAVRCGVPPDTIRADVDAFLATLVARRLLDPRPTVERSSEGDT